MAVQKRGTTLVRGADGALYEVSGESCKAMSEDSALASDTLGELQDPALNALNEDYAGARVFVDPGDQKSARVFVDPGDQKSARVFVDPGDHVSA